jgi:hypothetical protein
MIIAMTKIWPKIQYVIGNVLSIARYVSVEANSRYWLLSIMPTIIIKIMIMTAIIKNAGCESRKKVVIKINIHRKMSIKTTAASNILG